MGWQLRGLVTWEGRKLAENTPLVPLKNSFIKKNVIFCLSFSRITKTTDFILQHSIYLKLFPRGLYLWCMGSWEFAGNRLWDFRDIAKPFV